MQIISYPLLQKDYLIWVQWQGGKQWCIHVTTAIGDHYHEGATKPYTELCQATKAAFQKRINFPGY